MSTSSSPRRVVIAVALALGTAGAWFVVDGMGGDVVPGTGSASPSAPVPAVSDVATAAIERQVAPTPKQDATHIATPQAAAPEAAESEKSAATVTGRVIDTSGRPVAEATVARLSTRAPSQLVGDLPAEMRVEVKTTTDAEGTFHIGLARLGSFTLRASHAEHPATEYHGIAQAERLDDVRIVLRMGATISGRVVGAPADAGKLTVIARALDTAVESVARAPMAALIDVKGLLEGLDLPAGADQADAGAGGVFELRGLDPDRRYRLCAARRTDDIPMPQRCTAAVEVAAGARGVELVWREPFALTLRVIDDETGAPLETLDVSAGPVQQMKVLGMSIPVPMLQPLPQHSFAGGTVVIRGLAIDPGQDLRFGVRVGAHGRRSWSREDIVPTQGVMDLGVVRLSAAPIVQVRVAHRGRPVAGAEVRLEQVADAEPANADRTHSISFSTNVRSTSDSTQAITESQRSAADRDRVTTGSDGSCELTANFTGSGRLVVESGQHARFSGQPFSLPVRGTVQQQVELVLGGVAHVRAIDGHGEALAGVAVKRKGPDDDTDSRQADASGAVTFEHLAPGEHTFALAKPRAEGGLRVGISIDGSEQAGAGASITATFTDEERRDLLLQEPLRGTLQGTITLDNEPLDRAEVRLASPATDDAKAEAAAELGAAIEGMLGSVLGESSARAKTDDDGMYRLDGVPAGDYRLVVTSPRLAMPASASIHIGEGPNVHDLALRRTILRGRVLGADGRPLSGATVEAAVFVENEPAEVADAASAIGDFFGASMQRGVRTGADGTFELMGVRPSVPLRVRAEANMHVPQSCRVEAIGEGELREGIELRLLAAGRIRVRANLEGVMSVTARWAGVGAAPLDRSQHSAVLKNGRATLDGLAPGSWRLTLDGTDAAKNQERLVEVQAGQTASIEF